MLWLIEPLSFVFMRQAIAIGFLLGILSAVVGSYLILQQMGMMSGVISHAVLPGISIAFFIWFLTTRLIGLRVVWSCQEG